MSSTTASRTQSQAPIARWLRHYRCLGIAFGVGLGRLRRLVNALTAVQTATGLIVQDYRTAEQLNSMGAAQVSDAMRPVGEALYGGRRDA